MGLYCYCVSLEWGEGEHEHKDDEYGESHCSCYLDEKPRISLFVYDEKVPGRQEVMPYGEKEGRIATHLASLPWFHLARLVFRQDRISSCPEANNFQSTVSTSHLGTFGFFNAVVRSA